MYIKWVGIEPFPLRWWKVAPNFGDLIGPYLINSITGRPVAYVPPNRKHMLSVGSIIEQANENSLVWGSGSFGDEPPNSLSKSAKYLAVRGPLTRNLLRYNGVKMPRVFGDPALLMPRYYQNLVPVEHDIGFVVRWSDNKWKTLPPLEGVKIIDLNSDDVTNVLDQIFSCRKIITSSLHGLIIADAYEIPSAWIISNSPRGHEFKFFDYFLSVEKIRTPLEQNFILNNWNYHSLSQVKYDKRPIHIDLDLLLSFFPSEPDF
jgi:pyruvyltransferase